MKLKFIHSLVAAALIVGAAGCFSSCKDTDEDLFLKLQDQNKTLQEEMDGQISTLKGDLAKLQGLYTELATKQAECAANCGKAIAALKAADTRDSLLIVALTDSIKNLRSDFAKLSAAKDAIGKQLNKLETRVDVLSDSIKNNNLAILAVDTRVDSLAAAVATADSAIYAKYDAEIDSIYKLLAATGDTTVINNITNNFNTTIEQKLDSMRTDFGLALDTIKNNFQEQIDTLNVKVAKLLALETTVNTLKTSLETVESTLNSVKTDVATIKTDVSTLRSDVDRLTLVVGQVQILAQKALSKANANEAAIKALKLADDALQQQIDALQTQVDGINSCECDPAVINALQKLANENKDAIEALSDDLDQYKTEAAQALQDAINTLDTDLRSYIDQQDNATLTSAKDFTTTSIADFKKDVVDPLDQKLQGLETRVKATEDAIDEITDQINDLLKLQDRVSALEDRVSGIVIQQVSNPIFGNILLPIDVQSMILFNYWGNAFANITFPDFTGNTSTNYGTTYNDIDPSFLGSIEYTTLTAGQDFMDEEYGNLGKVYFTVNPTNVDLSEKEFTLVNSEDKESDIKLTNVRPCTETLTFGGHKAKGVAGQASNGFYVADATVSVTGAQNIKIEVENGTKADLKDAIKKHNLSSLGTVAKILYKNFNGKVPALGVKASWQEVVDGVSSNNATISQYSIAGTTFRPLSYGTAYNVDLAGRMPVFPSLDRLKEKFENLESSITGMFKKFKFHDGTGIDIKPITVSISDIKPIVFNLEEIEVSVGIDIIEVAVTVPSQSVFDNNDNLIGTTESFTAVGKCSNLTEINAAIADAIHEAFAKVQDSLNDKMVDVVADINHSLTEIQNQLDKQVNDMIASVNSQFTDLLNSLEDDVNEYLDDVIGSIQSTVDGKIESVFNRIEGYYNRIESVYNRIKDMLSDPNHYMQVTMFYSYSGKMGHMSNSKAAPTVFGGNGTAVTLVPTTYNAEILSPAYQKYVAVTNVYDKNGNDAKHKDPTCMALLEAANQGLYMNTVIPGARRTVVFNFEEGRGKGCTYEIFYQALDYHGLTSTQKFYVTVK